MSIHRAIVEAEQSLEIEPVADRPRRARPDPSLTIGDVLDAAREFVGADLAYIGQFKDQRQIFRWVAGDAASFGIRAGGSIPLADTLCRELISSRLPGLVPDTSLNPLARDAHITASAGIGAYVAAPIMSSNGRLFGTLCVVSHDPDPSLDHRHERFVTLMGRLVAEQIEVEGSSSEARRMRFERVRHAIEGARSIQIALQPIVNLGDGNVVGYEALARFADGRPPDVWFAEAWAVGLGIDLELAVTRAALVAMRTAPGGSYLSVNLSHRAAMAASLPSILEDFDPERLVIELTEHDEIANYDEVAEGLAELRKHGIRLAVDDIGAGFASLRHVLYLAPDMLKLDVSLTRGIDHDAARGALTSLLVAFAARLGATVVAEGIETASQLEALRVLGVQCGQGFLLGAPEVGVTRHFIDITAGKRLPTEFFSSSSDSNSHAE